MDAETDSLLSSSLVVQCGAPVYWKNRYSKCSETEWYGPLIEKRWSRMNPQVPLLNLGAGACLEPGSDGGALVADAECRSFVAEFTRRSAVTTVRDPLAAEIVRQCSGQDVPVLPCPSVLSPRYLKLHGQPGEYAALNYMPAGGHYDLAGNGPETAGKWEETFCRTARRLAARHDCLMICHDRTELKEAERLLPEIPRFHSPRWEDYPAVYARSKFAVLNRVHGAMVAAALGKKVLLTGNDTRLLTAQAMPNIRPLWITEAVDKLEDETERLSAAPDPDVTGFLDETEERYLKLLRPLAF